MFDWIFLANFIACFVAVPLTILAIVGVVYIIGVSCEICDGKDPDRFKKDLIRVTKLPFVLVVIGSLCVATASVPGIMVESNIDRVKINYTSPQAISKVEKGALKVVEKLDKLIDKGIEQVSGEAETGNGGDRPVEE